MMQELATIIGILVVICIIMYVGVHRTKEGLETRPPATTTGVAGNAASYAASIKAEVVKLQDELLLSKYRTDYEQAIVNMDDLVGMMMIREVLNVSVNEPMTTLNNLNTLQSARTSLNATMKFLDGQ